MSLGLFDKALFTTDGILTSRAIQSRYLDGIARRTGEIPIIVEYWLLEVTPRAGLVFVHKNGETAYKNPDNEQQKPSFCTEDYIRQNEINPQHNLPQKSAVEKSVENRRESCTRIMALLQAFTGINMQGDKQTRKQVYSLFDRGYTEKDVKAVTWSASYWVDEIQDTFGKGVFVPVQQTMKTLSLPMKQLGADFDSKLMCTRLWLQRFLKRPED